MEVHIFTLLIYFIFLWHLSPKHLEGYQFPHRKPSISTTILQIKIQRNSCSSLLKNCYNETGFVLFYGLSPVKQFQISNLYR